MMRHRVHCDRISPRPDAALVSERTKGLMKSLRFRCFATLSVLVAALVLACGQHPGAAPAALEDTPENRNAQIDRYLQAMPPETLLEDIVSKMSARMPDEQRGRFIDSMKKQFDTVKLRTVMHDGMAKHFTADEVRALADFYGSALGKSAMAKFGNYMADVMPAIQAEILAAVAKVESEMQKSAGAPGGAPAPGEAAPGEAAPAPPAEGAEKPAPEPTKP
jgi:uncharacterized protein